MIHTLSAGWWISSNTVCYLGSKGLKGFCFVYFYNALYGLEVRTKQFPPVMRPTAGYPVTILKLSLLLLPQPGLITHCLSPRLKIPSTCWSLLRGFTTSWSLPFLSTYSVLSKCLLIQRMSKWTNYIQSHCYWFRIVDIMSLTKV